MGANRINEAKAFICSGYKLTAYRTAKGDPGTPSARPSIFSSKLMILCPLYPSQIRQDGLPSKGPRKRKSVKPNGEFHSSSVHNAMTTASSTSSNTGSGSASSSRGTPSTSMATPPLESLS